MRPLLKTRYIPRILQHCFPGLTNAFTNDIYRHWPKASFQDQCPWYEAARCRQCRRLLRLKPLVQMECWLACDASLATSLINEIPTYARQVSDIKHSSEGSIRFHSRNKTRKASSSLAWLCVWSLWLWCQAQSRFLLKTDTRRQNHEIRGSEHGVMQVDAAEKSGCNLQHVCGLVLFALWMHYMG